MQIHVIGLLFSLGLLGGCSRAPAPPKTEKDDTVKLQYGVTIDKVIVSEISENDNRLFVHYHPPGEQTNLLVNYGLTDEQIGKLKSGSKLAIGDFNAGMKDRGHTKEIPFQFVPKNTRVCLVLRDDDFARIQSIVVAGVSRKEKEFLVRYLNKRGDEDIFSWLGATDEQGEALKSGGKILVHSETGRFLQTPAVAVDNKAVLLLLKGSK